MTKRITERTRMILALRRQNPQLTGADIGRLVGVSRERVRQVLQEEQLVTRKSYKCTQCGKYFVEGYNYELCSSECRRAKYYSPIKCVTCGTMFWRLKSVVRIRERRPEYTSKLQFCSMSCSSRRPGRGKV